MREPVSVEERVAVTIWKLATNVEYRTLASLFGLGRATVGRIVVETCSEIAMHLLPRYVQIHSGEKLKEIIEGFETVWGFPQAAGAIDGSHIPIIRPDDSASDYYNRKGYYSVIMQAMVDHRGLFMDVYIGWPGKVHDARVFVNSSLYQRGESGTLFPDWKRLIHGTNVHNNYADQVFLQVHCVLSMYFYDGIFTYAGITCGSRRPSLSFTELAHEALCRDSSYNTGTKAL